MRPLTIVLTGLLIAATSAHGQVDGSTFAPAKEPKTSIEVVQGKTGAVLVKAFTEVGQISLKSGALEVEARQVTDGSTGQKIKGIYITVRDGDGGTAKYGVSAVDYDEVDALVKGIDSLPKAGKGVTTHDSFEAFYRTKGDLVVSTFSVADDQIGVSIDAGVSNPKTAFLDLKKLAEFKGLILKAKSLLDEKK